MVSCGCLPGFPMDLRVSVGVCCTRLFHYAQSVQRVRGLMFVIVLVSSGSTECSLYVVTFACEVSLDLLVSFREVCCCTE